MAYFERGGLEKEQGGSPRSTYSRGNTSLHTIVKFKYMTITRVGHTQNTVHLSHNNYQHIIVQVPMTNYFGKIVLNINSNCGCNQDQCSVLCIKCSWKTVDTFYFIFKIHQLKMYLTHI